VGVEVLGGGGVFEGWAVWVGIAVTGDWVAEGVTAEVEVAGTLAGRLQPEMTKAMTSMDNKTCDLMTLSFMG
jgi:hypothetical protein